MGWVQPSAPAKPASPRPIYFADWLYGSISSFLESTGPLAPRVARFERFNLSQRHHSLVPMPQMCKEATFHVYWVQKWASQVSLRGASSFCLSATVTVVDPLLHIHNKQIKFKENIWFQMNSDCFKIGKEVGQFLHFLASTRDQLKAYVLIYHLLPSPAPSAVSNAAPTKSADSATCHSMEKSIVPVSPTGTMGSFSPDYWAHAHTWHGNGSLAATLCERKK